MFKPCWDVSVVRAEGTHSFQPKAPLFRSSKWTLAATHHLKCAAINKQAAMQHCPINGLGALKSLGYYEYAMLQHCQGWPLCIRGPHCTAHREVQVSNPLPLDFHGLSSSPSNHVPLLREHQLSCGWLLWPLTQGYFPHPFTSRRAHSLVNSVGIPQKQAHHIFKAYLGRQAAEVIRGVLLILNSRV